MDSSYDINIIHFSNAQEVFQIFILTNILVRAAFFKALSTYNPSWIWE